jgi:hypothetical protein
MIVLSLRSGESVVKNMLTPNLTTLGLTAFNFLSERILFAFSQLSWKIIDFKNVIEFFKNSGNYFT